MRMNKSLPSIATAVVAQGIGVYAYHLIASKTEPGTTVRWIAVSVPALFGLVTPLALEVMDVMDIGEGPPQIS